MLAIFGNYSLFKISTGLNRSIYIFPLIFLILLLSSESHAQNVSAKDTLIAVIDGDKFYLSDLKSFYEMQSVAPSYSDQELRDFLPLFVNYQLKLKEGIKNDLHHSPELKDELNLFAREAAYSYWIDHKLRDSLFQQYKERFEYEIKSFHILQNLPQNPAPSDTLYAYDTLISAKKEFSDGVSLDNLNQKYSTFLKDRYAGGQLPWITAGSVVKPFEDTIYNLEPGEISTPVRTRFGYHLIYVQDKRPRTPERFISHIFVRKGNSGEGEEKIKQALQALNNGESWNSVVLSFTEDGMSRNRSGNIGWTGYGSQYDESFIDAVFTLDTTSTYSEPILTGYGYHIFRVDSVRNFSSESEKEMYLEEKFKNTSTYKIDKPAVLNFISQVGNLEINISGINALNRFFAASGETDLENITLPDSLENRILFQFDGNSFDSRLYFDWLLENHPNADAEKVPTAWFEEFQKSVLESHLVSFTVKQNPGFNKQINHFRDGLIVFKLSNDYIWNRSNTDSTSAGNDFEKREQEYLEQLRKKYKVSVYHE